MARSLIDLEPQYLDLIAYSGDGLSFSLAVTDDAAAPVNLTGTMIAQVRVTRLTPDPPLTTFAVDLTQAVDGIAVLSLTGEQTDTLSNGTPPSEKFEGEWDLQWTATGKEPVTLVQGKIEVLPDVSH